MRRHRPNSDGRIERAFGETVREFREARGLTQDELSLACGHHRTYLSVLERGEKSPTLLTSFNLARALNVPLSDLIQRVEAALK
jgi:transcriptional regulator with XRE-family HTH domain